MWRQAILVDPKYSDIDVVQMVGRVMRPAGGKDCGYVLVPLFVDEAGDSLQSGIDDGSVELGNYKVALAVMKALMCARPDQNLACPILS